MNKTILFLLLFPSFIHPSDKTLASKIIAYRIAARAMRISSDLTPKDFWENLKKKKEPPESHKKITTTPFNNIDSI